jgi:hypothetical protein
VQIKFEFGNGPLVFDRVFPLELKKNNRNFQFPFIIFVRVAHIHRITEVKFECSFGPMIFYRVIPLEKISVPAL